MNSLSPRAMLLLTASWVCVANDLLSHDWESALHNLENVRDGIRIIQRLELDAAEEIARRQAVDSNTPS